MPKDPAFLFYPNDWLGGTLGMTFEEKGAYMELLMLQFNRGHMTNDMIAQTVGQLFGQIQDKFIQDEQGLWFNARLEYEKNRRKKYVESRANNKSGENQHTKKEKKEAGHMTNHTKGHMENENLYIDINKNNSSNISNISTNDIIINSNNLKSEKEKKIEKKEKGEILKIEEKYLCPEMLKIFNSKVEKYISDPQRDFEPLISIATFFHGYLNLNTPITQLNAEILALWGSVSTYIAKDDFYAQKSLKTISNHIQEILNKTLNGKSTKSPQSDRSKLSSNAVIRPDKTFSTVF
jgi:uncharacterized protein YdaU (DUF1376 family)